MLCLMARSPMTWSSSREKILPMGLWGVLRTIILVFWGVMAWERRHGSRIHSEAEVRVWWALGGGVRGTYLMVAPGIWILEMYLVRGKRNGCVSDRCWMERGNGGGWMRSLLVEEGLEHDDLVAGFEESHESAKHPFVCTRSDHDFGLWIDGFAEEGGVGVCNRFLQSRSALIYTSV